MSFENLIFINISICVYILLYSWKINYILDNTCIQQCIIHVVYIY